MKNTIIVLCVLITAIAKGQILGGRSTFSFLEIPTNAHISGLGGYTASVVDSDPNLFLANPALLNDKMDKVVSFNYLPYIAGIKSYAIAAAINHKKLGPFAFSLNYLNYGDLDENTDDGTNVGTFGAKDYVFAVGKSYTLGVITLGANAKFIGSEIASYTKYGYGFDGGALFKHPEHDFTFGLTVKNMGGIIKQYTPLSSDTMPLNVMLGASYKLSKAPLRISMTAHHLNKWDIVYNDPTNSTQVDENGDPVIKKTKNIDRLMRHLTWSLEIMPAKFLSVRAGYNYLLSKEMSLNDNISIAGASLGGSVKWEFLEAAYTHTFVHRAGGMNTFTLNVDLNKISNL